MYFVRYNLFLTLTIWLFGCSSGEQENKTNKEGKLIASVNDNVLYESDIQDIVPFNSSAKDSTEIVNRYINNWIRKQLLFSQAKEQLTLDNPDIERKVEDYRYSLYIFELKEKLISSRLDSNISEKELQEFYNKEISNFLLQGTILQGIWVRIPLHSGLEKSVRNQFSLTLVPLEAMVQFVNENKFLSRNSIGTWLESDAFLEGTPFNSQNILGEWKKGVPYLTSQGKEFLYLLKITGLKQAIEPAPIDYVKENIKAIILNKRKLALANELEDQLFNEASKKNKVEIYH